MKKLYFLILLTVLPYSQILYGKSRVPISHTHEGRTHVHLLPIEGLKHTHKKLKNSKKNNSLIKIIKNSITPRKNIKYGYYSKDKIKIRWLNNGNKSQLLETLIFTDPKGKKWIAPKGHIIDGASIPDLLQPFIGSPYGGRYVMASIIHDVACDNKKESWKSVHKVFHYAMLSSGVPIDKANLMYKAVYEGGPRWGKDAEKKLSEKEIKKLLNTKEFSFLRTVSVRNIGLKKYSGTATYTKYEYLKPVAVGIYGKYNNFTAYVEIRMDGKMGVGWGYRWGGGDATAQTAQERYGNRAYNNKNDTRVLKQQ